MITYIGKQHDGFWRDGKFMEQVECYITDTSELCKVPNNAPGSKALNLTTEELWILRSDFKWHKFGSENVYIEPIEITWDGDIEGKTVITVIDNTYLCKVSDKVLDMESIDGASIETTSLVDGNVSTTKAEDGINTMMLNSGGVAVINSEGICVAVSSNAGTVIYYDVPIEVPESGTYFTLYDDEVLGLYTSRLTKEAVIA